MTRPAKNLVLLAVAAAPFLFAFSAQGQAQKTDEPTCEQVYKNIQVFKGVPASDLDPSMQFMAASLGYECTDCHDASDFSKDTRAKQTARKMILMQRDIDEKNFNGRNEVTCMTCHRGSEHPMGTPLPDGLNLRHKRMENAPKAEDLFSKAVAAAGEPAAIEYTGTMTAPNDVTHKVESKPVTFIQAPGGKFSLVTPDRKIQSDGTHTWYFGMSLEGEPQLIFNRFGQARRGNDAFAGLDRPSVSGEDKIGKTAVICVRATNAGSSSTQELCFDEKTGLLARVMNARRCNLGTDVTAVDYSNYRSLGGMHVPMKVVLRFAGAQQWTLDFRSVKLDPSVSEDVFRPAKSG